MKSKESVEKQIKMYSMMKTDNAYYLKAKALMDLFDITGEKSDAQKAIEAYSSAINLKKDSTYLCERAKAYSKIGLTKEAVMDFKSAQSIDNGSDILKNYHTQNLLKDLATLDDIKSTIKKLRAEGALPKDFLDSYDDLVDVVTGMRVKVSEHDKQLDYIMKEVAEIKLAMQQGGNIEELKQKFIVLSQEVKIVREETYKASGDAELALSMVKIVKEVVYDNELLNHPELLKLAAKKFGMTKALDLCDWLSADLVIEAIEHGSAELVLGGCISLNHGDIN